MTTNPIADAIKFIGVRDAEFGKQIRGASEEDIDRLERAAGKPLLPIHRHYLERLGRSSSWLKLGAAHFDVDSLIRFHEYYGEPDPEDHWLIGRASGDPGYNCYLWVENPDRVRVVSFPPDGNLLRIAGSLEQLICDRALAVFCDQKMPHHRQTEDLAGRQESRVDHLDALLARMGLSPHWFSNDWFRTYESHDALVSAYEVPDRHRLIVDVRATTRDELNRVFSDVRAFVKDG